MDKFLAWGIEARWNDVTVSTMDVEVIKAPIFTQWQYFYREVSVDQTSPIAKREDGDEIEFGCGTGGSLIPLPEPSLCNLHLAIARVSHASGASEIFDKFTDDEDPDGIQVPAYFGSPFISEEALMRRLDILAH